MKTLNEIPHKNPFKVPENYFEEVNRRIISATSCHEQRINKGKAYEGFRRYLLVAASVAGLVLISYSAMKLFTTDKNHLNISEVLYEENPESYLNDIDIHSLEELPSSLFIIDEGPLVSKSELIDYLILENVEINDIYEQL
jgi:hypothetical protein